jgi:hypothetical protein
MSIMNRVADKIEMIARSATKVVVKATMPRSAPRRAHDFGATLWDMALRAICGVRLRHVTAQQPLAGAAACNPLPHRTHTRTVSGVPLLAKGLAIRVVAFLSTHPAKPMSRSCGTYSEVP